VPTKLALRIVLAEQADHKKKKHFDLSKNCDGQFKCSRTSQTSLEITNFFLDTQLTGRHLRGFEGNTVVSVTAAQYQQHQI